MVCSQYCYYYHNYYYYYYYCYYYHYYYYYYYLLDWDDVCEKATAWQTRLQTALLEVNSDNMVKKIVDADHAGEVSALTNRGWTDGQTDRSEGGFRDAIIFPVYPFCLLFHNLLPSKIFFFYPGC